MGVPPNCQVTQQPSDDDENIKYILGGDEGVYCVYRALRSETGVKPSGRFLALLAASTQKNFGPFSRDENMKFKERMIQMVQAYGFCEEPGSKNGAGADNGDKNLTVYRQAFATPQKESGPAKLMRDWALGQNFTMKNRTPAPKDYISGAYSGGNSGDAYKEFQHLFGVDTETSWMAGKSNYEGLFGHDVSEWDRQKPHERAHHWAISAGETNLIQEDGTSKGRDNSLAWNICRENARTRVRTRGPFNLQATTGGADYNDRVTWKKIKADDVDPHWDRVDYYNDPKDLEERRQRAQDVSQQSLSLCSAMARSCGVTTDTQTLCGFANPKGPLPGSHPSSAPPPREPTRLSPYGRSPEVSQ
jgi:hypothetical protein